MRYAVVLMVLAIIGIVGTMNTVAEVGDVGNVTLSGLQGPMYTSLDQLAHNVDVYDYSFNVLNIIPRSPDGTIAALI